jgi:hypothetical protein
MIFTVHPATLKEEYPVFNNGPQQYKGASAGTSIDRVCRLSQCKYRHVCNRCYAEHPGNTCSGDEGPSALNKKAKVHSTSGHRQSTQAKR